MTSAGPSRALATLLLAVATACSSSRAPDAPPTASTPHHGAPRRAILVSFDSFSERRALETLDAARIPEIHALLGESACAEYAIAHFPSVTAPGHAAIWTGAYGDVNGVVANLQPRLPRERHTIMELATGYSAEALRAEPIWIAAGGAGRRVVAHQVTQAPDPPGYPPVTGEADVTLIAARSRAEGVLAMPNVHVLNGYNALVAPDTIITERDAPPRPASGWQGVESLGSGVTPLEIAWRAGPDSVFALLHGKERYDRALVSLARDATGGVTAQLEPPESEWPRGRPLARNFSEPLEARTGSGSYFVQVRLFELAPDGASFLLFQPKLVIVQGNRPDVERSYASAVRGWIGNGATQLYRRGLLGRTIMDGGDGTAERRYLESLELLTRQFMRGSEWGWTEMQAELLADYFPLGDEVDHLWLGFVDPGTPMYDAAIGEPLAELRERAWQMLDLRLGHLRALVAATPGSALFVTGDHGMRTTWRIFRPNAALLDAGLLALDTAGRVDPARSRAAAPNGYYVMINRIAWQSGTVPPEDEPRVATAAERALLAARTPEGTPIVTRIFRASAEGDSLGLGGPVGGDLYFETAPGYRWSWEADRAVSEEHEPNAGHGFPSVAPDMYTAFCAYGPDIPARRIPGLLVIHAAPTVAEWLGIPAPADSRGRSVLSSLLGRRAAR